jgi:hypothetical protein
MKPKADKYQRSFGWLAAIAAAFQAIGLIRYVRRLPGDWIGIALYAITLVAFILVIIGSFLQVRTKAE